MTVLIIVATSLVSIMAFSRPVWVDKLQFNASKVIHQNEYYRLISHGFVHANWEHLIVNMFVLYSFGKAIEMYFEYGFGRMANAYFLLLYFGGMLVANTYALYKHRNNYYYNAVGASGAVSTVLFAAIFYDPWSKILLFAVLPIPGIVFGVAYLAYSYYMSRKESDHVAHDAHLLGALFGFIFPILLNRNNFEFFLDKLFRVM